MHGASSDLELDLPKVGRWNAIGYLQHLNADDLIVGVEVEHDAGVDLLRLDDRGIVQAEVQGIGVGIDVKLHSLFLDVGSTYAVTTRGGFVVSL